MTKSITLTPKQAFGGGASIAIIAGLLVGPLQEYFPTRREANVQIEHQKDQILRIEDSIKELKLEFKTALKESKDEIINKIDAVELRSVRHSDGIDKRIENLEASVFLKPRRNAN